MPGVPVPSRACTLALPRRCRAALNTCACTPAHSYTGAVCGNPSACTAACLHIRAPAHPYSCAQLRSRDAFCVHTPRFKPLFSESDIASKNISACFTTYLYGKHIRNHQNNLPAAPSWRQRYRHKYPAIKPHPSDFFTHRHPGLDLRSNSPIYDARACALKSSGTQDYYVQITTVRRLLRPAVAILAIL